MCFTLDPSLLSSQSVFVYNSQIYEFVIDGFLRGTWDQNVNPVFIAYIFKSFTEEELCAKFCGVSISFHEIMKWQNFGFGVTSYQSMYKKCSRQFFFPIFLLMLWRKSFLQCLMVFFTIFHEITKLCRFEWLLWLTC